MTATPQTFVPAISEEVPWSTAHHIRLLYQAFGTVKTDLANIKSGATTENITNVTNSVIGDGGGGTNPFPGLGSVSNREGLTAYTTASTDNGALILVGDASPIAVTLNSALVTPFFTSVSNTGTSTATLTPSTGTINGSATLALPAGSWVTVYFDGVNWDAESPGSTAGGVSQVVAGAGIAVTPAGGMGVVTVSSTGGGGVARGALNTNANGSWWVWGDGVVEEWGSITVIANSANKNSGVITFPFAFPTFPQSVQVAILGFPRGSSTDTASVLISTMSASSATLELQCNVPTGGGGVTFDQNVTVLWRAIGT